MEISHDWSNVTGYGYITVKQYTNNGLKIKKTIFIYIKEENNYGIFR